MVLRCVRVFVLLVAAVALNGAACKREEPAAPPADERLTRFPAIDLEQNGVVMHMALPGWEHTGHDADGDVHIYESGGRKLLVQLRRYRVTDPSLLPEEAAGEALKGFCVQPPCTGKPIKPGYWLSHYDSQQDGALVLHWDLASLPARDVVALAMLKLSGADESAHKHFELALKESFRVSLAPEKK